MNMEQLLQTGEDILSQSEIAESKLDAWYLMEFYFHMNRVSFWVNKEKAVAGEEVEGYLSLIKRRSGHIPLQYITGEQEFMGLTFAVNEAVLIPRQDTECLVEKVLPFCRDKRVLDLCTGSGCIAISLKKLGAAKEVCGTDLSANALLLAEENARRNEVSVNWVQSDLFASVQGRYDIIVSNPPYIASAEVEKLMPEVRVHEPRMALDGREDGLFFYRAIAEKASQYLFEDGRIFFEIGYDQAEAVSLLLKKARFTQIETFQDLAGLDRVVCGRLL